MNTELISAEMFSAANIAAMKFFNDQLGGKDNYPCGFAWITIFPEHKGNTKEGRAERKIIEAIGAKKNDDGKTYRIWNPGKLNCQNVDAKESGANAAAAVLRKHGFKVYAESRLD